MRLNVDRMGERFNLVTPGWLRGIVTGREMDRVVAMKVGDKLEFSRGLTGVVGQSKPLIIWRVS